MSDEKKVPEAKPVGPAAGTSPAPSRAASGLLALLAGAVVYYLSYVSLLPIVVYRPLERVIRE